MSNFNNNHVCGKIIVHYRGGQELEISLYGTQTTNNQKQIRDTAKQILEGAILNDVRRIDVTTTDKTGLYGQIIDVFRPNCKGNLIWLSPARRAIESFSSIFERRR